MLKDFIQEYPLFYDCIIVVLALGVCAIADFLVKKIILRGLKKIFYRLADSDQNGNSLVLKIASRLANIVPVIILYYVPAFVPDAKESVTLIVQKISIILLIIFLTKSLMLMLDLCDVFYQKRENAESRPIKGYLQLGKILLVVIAAILVISFILDKSPVLMLS